MKKNFFENYSHLGDLHDHEAEYEIAPELVEHKDVLALQKVDQPYFRYFYFFGLLLAGILVFKLVNIQITNGYANQLLADNNRVRTLKLEPPRGSIIDSQGVPLVRNTPSYRLDVYPADLPKKKSDRLILYKKVVQITGLSEKSLLKIDLQGLASQEPVTLQENVERDTALAWESRLNDYPSFVITKDSTRAYSLIPGLSHILGYTGKISKKELQSNKSDYNTISRTGKNGIEKFYESTLRGKIGIEELEVDSKGRTQRTLSTKLPITGNNLSLSIDTRLQSAAVSALQQAFIDNKSDKGIVVAINPQDGSILAYASLPSYDNNLFSRGITQKEYNSLLEDKNRPLLDRIASGTYPSGSVIKPMVSIAGLQEKTITPSTKLDTSAGAIKIGQWVFPDWKVHGIADVRQAIAESNDIFFYALGGGYQNIKGMGVDRLGQWYKKFGFGTATGVDLPNESFGLVPTDAWKRKTQKEPWYIGDTYHMSIGQGYFLATPLQMAVATSAIANNGDILKPHLASKVVDNNGNILKTITKEVVKSGIADKENLKVVQEGMRLCVTAGSAFVLRNLPFTSAAKTGTAQFGDNTNSHAWFTAYAPYENPEIAVVVMIEGGGQGSTTSGPVAKSILEAYFNNKK